MIKQRLMKCDEARGIFWPSGPIQRIFTVRKGRDDNVTTSLLQATRYHYRSLPKVVTRILMRSSACSAVPKAAKLNGQIDPQFRSR